MHIPETAPYQPHKKKYQHNNLVRCEQVPILVAIITKGTEHKVVGNKLETKQTEVQNNHDTYQYKGYCSNDDFLLYLKLL